MPLTALGPMERASLGVLYQFDVPMTPRVAAANFTIEEDVAAQVMGRLKLHGFVTEPEPGLFVISDRGRSAVAESAIFRGGEMAV